MADGFTKPLLLILCTLFTECICASAALGVGDHIEEPYDSRGVPCVGRYLAVLGFPAGTACPPRKTLLPTRSDSHGRSVRDMGRAVGP